MNTASKQLERELKQEYDLSLEDLLTSEETINADAAEIVAWLLLYKETALEEMPIE